MPLGLGAIENHKILLCLQIGVRVTWEQQIAKFDGWIIAGSTVVGAALGAVNGGTFIATVGYGVGGAFVGMFLARAILPMVPAVAILLGISGVVFLVVRGCT